MKNILNFFIALLLMVFCLSCTKKFNEINTNPKVLTVDNLNQASYGFVVTRAFFGGVYFDDPMTFLRGHGAFSDVYSDYQSHLNTAFFSDNFIFEGAWLDVFFTNFYSEDAPQIKYAEDFAVKNGFDIENAMMKTWKVYVYDKITDFFGPIPYSQFGNGATSVPYDSQSDIYANFFATLDSAVAIFKNNVGQTSFLGSQDVIFSGNVNEWLKFANSLRLRLALRVKYVEPEVAKTQAEEAVADGVVEDNADNGYVHPTVFFHNQYVTISAWSDYRMSADMESILKGYRDPRVANYFTPAAEPDPTDDPPGVVFNWEGVRNGLPISLKQSTDFTDLGSDMGTMYRKPGTAGPNKPLLRAAECYFLRAEGALEGWNMGGGTANSYYNAGITASLEENGGNGMNLANEDYVTSPDVPMGYNATAAPASTVPILFDASGSKERQLEQIITQKWIALYPDSEEAWAEKRRTNYPTFYPRLQSLNPNLTVDMIPRRVPFVTSEYNNNRAAVEDAITKLGGPDLGITKLWWDKKP